MYATEPSGCTALHEAARSYVRIETVEILLSAGADVNAKNRNGDTALQMHAAAMGMYGNIDAVKALLSAGVDVNAVTREGKTALDLATKRGRREIMKELQKAEAARK